MATMQKIISNLWFDSNAEEAVNFYLGIFKNASIGRTAYFSEVGFEQHGRPAGSVMTIEFTLEGVNFLALNGGPHFKFNEAISFIINCETQEEVDYYWNKLGEGGDEKAQMCGWLKDKFGLSWQVVPTILDEMLLSEDKKKADQAMAAMLQMKKLDIQALKDAFNK